MKSEWIYNYLTARLNISEGIQHDQKELIEISAVLKHLFCKIINFLAHSKLTLFIGSKIKQNHIILLQIIKDNWFL